MGVCGSAYCPDGCFNDVNSSGYRDGAIPALFTPLHPAYSSAELDITAPLSLCTALVYECHWCEFGVVSFLL